LLKAGAGRVSFVDQLFDWHTVLGLVLYGGAAMLYIVALRRIPMSVAMPFTANVIWQAAPANYWAVSGFNANGSSVFDGMASPGPQFNGITGPQFYGVGVPCSGNGC